MDTRELHCNGGHLRGSDLAARQEVRDANHFGARFLSAILAHETDVCFLARRGLRTLDTVLLQHRRHLGLAAHLVQHPHLSGRLGELLDKQVCSTNHVKTRRDCGNVRRLDVGCRPNHEKEHRQHLVGAIDDHVHVGGDLVVGAAKAEDGPDNEAHDPIQHRLCHSGHTRRENCGDRLLRPRHDAEPPIGVRVAGEQITVGVEELCAVLVLRLLQEAALRTCSSQRMKQHCRHAWCWQLTAKIVQLVVIILDLLNVHGGRGVLLQFLEIDDEFVACRLAIGGRCGLEIEFLCHDEIAVDLANGHEPRENLVDDREDAERDKARIARLKTAANRQLHRMRCQLR
eukprot:2982072-Prymnesium_polylepis.2